jgi:hypothetical protein
MICWTAENLQIEVRLSVKTCLFFFFYRVLFALLDLILSVFFPSISAVGVVDLHLPEKEQHLW